MTELSSSREESEIERLQLSEAKTYYHYFMKDGCFYNRYKAINEDPYWIFNSDAEKDFYYGQNRYGYNPECKKGLAYFNPIYNSFEG